MNFLRKNMRVIFYITLGGFFAGIFVGFGGYFFGGGSTQGLAAEVNGHKIPMRRYNQLLTRTMDNLRQQKTEPTDEITRQKKHEVMQDLIQEEVFWQEAKKYGIKVTDSEIAMEIQHYPAFQQDGKFDQRAYFHVLNQVLHSTPQEFEESRRRQIAYLKLRDLVASSIVISEPELKYAYLKANKNDLKNYEKDREAFSGKIRQEKVMMVFNEWFKQLNQGMKVKIYLKDEPAA